MKKNFVKSKLGSAILAVLLVIIMSAGAFAGAVQNSSDSDQNTIEPLVPYNEDAEKSNENSLIPTTEDSTPIFVDPIIDIEESLIPGDDPEQGPEMSDYYNFNENNMYTSVTNADGSIVDIEDDQDIMPGVSGNIFSEALNQVTESSNIDEYTNSESTTRAPLATVTMVLGTENTQKTGNGMGYSRVSGTTYYSYDGYYMYNYWRSTYEYRGWASYNLESIEQYNGATVTSGAIWIRNYQRYYATGVDFYALKTVPYDGMASSDAKKIYDESGGSGTTKLGAFSSTSTTDTTYHDIYVPLSSIGITEINKRLGNSEFDFSMGSDISSVSPSTTTYARWYCYDVRLMLNVSFSSMPDAGRGEVAVGDELSGYVSSTSLYNFGRVYSSSTSYRGFATWDAKLIKSLIPSQGPGGEKVILTGISVRLNSPYGYLATLGVYHMKTNPNGATASTIYTDAGDGTRYAYTATGSYISTAQELEWDLGADGLDDFNDTLDGTPNFFALGFSRSSNYNYMYSPQLVIKWKIEYPPMYGLRIGADNPEKVGQAMGYSRQSGSTYYSYSNYYTYIYKSSSSDYHGWAVFDLADLNQWSGVKVKSAKLIVHNQYRNYIKEMNFTALKTTPFNNPGSTIAQAIYSESGPSGKQIGQYVGSTTVDTTYHSIDIQLDTNAATEINNILSSSSTHKTFGIGMYVTSLHSGYTYGYLRWCDVRLEVDFEYSSDLQPTTGGNGIAFGDDWSGHVYKYTSPSDRPYGYMYVRKSTTYDYRAYAQWDIKSITQAFPEANFDDIKIDKVSMRFNHYRNSLTGISIYPMTYNVTSSTATEVYNDCGDGTAYYSSGTTGSSYNEYEWDLGKDAVKNFQAAFEDNDPDYFGIGMVTTSTSGYAYDFSPKLVIEWSLPEPNVFAALVDEPVGYEGTLMWFNANISRNVSGGTGGLVYEWDWDYDGIFDDKQLSPWINHTWCDDYTGKITLRVTDTYTGKNASADYNLIIKNVDPKVITANGGTSPQPAYEASTVTFSGYTVEDPSCNDTWKYFWDFDGDGVYDKGGNCNGKTIPPETWYFEDDFLGEASLLVVDEDGGSTNISTPHSVKAVPPTSGTGYVYYYGTKYSSSTIYYRWQYSYDYQRGWAKIDLSSIPTDCQITKVVFNTNVLYNYTVNMFGVHLLSSDPVSALGETVFKEAGDTSNRIFGLTGSLGTKQFDLTNYFKTTAGKAALEKALEEGWLGLGFDFESPNTYGYYYGYIEGYSYSSPFLEINYITTEPGCLIPVIVKNRPPEVNCNNLTITPTTVNEGDTISISDISFCDPGNDSYEAKIKVGNEFESDWIPLGEGPQPPSSDKDNIAPDATPTSSGGGSGTYGPDSLNDIDESNMCWVSTGTGGSSTAFYQLSWSSQRKISKMKVIIHGSWSNSGNRHLAGCDIEYWDGTKWVLDSKLTNIAGNFEYTFKSVRTTDKIRMHNLVVTGSQASNPCVYEWYVYPPSNGNWTPGWGAFGAGCFNVNLSVDIIIPDDHPISGTTWDNVPIEVMVRDDDDHTLIPGTGVGPANEPNTIFNNGYYSYSGRNGRKVVMDDDYNIYSIFINRQSSPYMVNIGKSTDGGVTWENYLVSDESYFVSTQYYPALTIDSNGILHAVWRDSTRIVYANSKDGGETWGDHYNVTNSGYHYYPSITVDEDDTVHIAWNGYMTSSPYKIWYINRTSSGTWGTAKQVSEAIYSYDPDIVTDSNNNVHIVWRGYLSSTMTYYNIRHRMLWSSNGTWSNINEVTNDKTSSVYHQYPSIAIDSNDDLHLVWSGRDTVMTVSYNIMYSMFDSSAGTWNAREYITEVTIGYPYQYSPSITINEAGELDVVWYGYQSPSWSSPYVLHHAEKIGTTWNINWNIYTSSGMQYYPNMMFSSPNSLAKKGFAFIWYDNYYQLKYFTSSDFEFGNPEFTDGLDSCKDSIRVNNIAPEFDTSAIYTIPSEVKEQEDFILHAEFMDPAAGASSETFEYNISWGNGDYTGWKEVEQFKAGYPAGLTELDIQPDSTEGKDTYVYGYSTYQNYNYGNYIYTYVGGYTSGSLNYIRKGLLQWDLSWIPAGYNVTDATMKLNFGYKYYYAPEKMHWYPVTEEWTEGDKTGTTGIGSELTWNNAPSFDNSTPIASIDWSSGGGFVEFDLNPSTVQGWINNPLSNFGMISQFDTEDGTDRNYGYFYTSDYTTATNRPQLILKFDKPLPRILPRGIIEESYMYPDDHPETATPMDIFDIAIDVRDDDLGTDDAETKITVNNVAPEILVGTVTPENLAMEGIPEGTKVILDGFRFDDVAFKEATENGFEYSIDWDDGTGPSPWSNDFQYTSNAGEFFQVKDSVYSSSTQYNNGRNLVMDSKGNMYSVYLDYPSPYQIYVSVSEDLGETWTRYQVSTDTDSKGQYQYYPTIAIDSKDVLHVAWQAYVPVPSPLTSRYSIRYANSTDGGQTWGNFKVIDLGSYLRDTNPSNNIYTYNYEQYPSIAVDNTDVVHIAWEHYKYFYNYTTGANPTNYYEYGIKYASNNGGSWGKPVDVDSWRGSTSPYEYNYRPSLAVDGSNNVHVVWYGTTQWSSRYNIKYSMLNASTSNWGSSELLTNSTIDYQYNPSIAVDLEDNVHVAWHGYPSPYQIKYIQKSGATGTWGSVEPITTNSNTNYYASVGVDQRGFVYIAWYKYSPYNIMMAINDGTGWGDEIEISTPAMFSSTTWYPSVMYGTNIAPEGVCLLFTGYYGSYNLYWTTSPDFYLGEVGPQRGLPTFEYMYRDDNPSGTDHDIYEIKIQIRDDDLGVGEWVLPLDVRNVWPVLDKDELELNLNSMENALYTPEVSFMDPGTNIPIPGSIGDEIYANGFESGELPNALWYIGTEYNVIDTDPNEGAYHLNGRLEAINNPLELIHPMDLTNYRNLEFTFYQYTYNTESNDRYHFEVTADNGSTWDRVGSWNGATLRTGDYRKFTINLSAYDGSPEFKFRFLFTASNRAEWWNIDDILLIGDKIVVHMDNERWHYWLDVDNSESLTPIDIQGVIGTVEVIDNVSYGTVPSIKTPFNDDYSGTIGLYMYDDDAPTEMQFINITYDVTGDGGVNAIKQGSYSSATAYNSGRNLVMDSKGNMYAVYTDYPSPYQIYVSVSDDMGDTWTQYKVSSDTASAGQYQYRPSIAIDSNDVLHVVWEGRTSSNPYASLRYANSGDGGKTWGNIQTIIAGLYSYVYPIRQYSYVYDPVVTIDSNDVVHVSWRHYGYFYNYTSGANPVYYNEYGIKYINNSGSGWGSAQDVVFWRGSSSPYYYHYSPTIEADKFNNIHIAWYGYSTVSTNTYNILYRKLDAVSGWQNVETITKESGGSSYSSYRPCITSDMNGNIHLVWYQQNYQWWNYYYNIRYAMFNATSSAWEPIENVTTSNSKYNYYPTVGVDQQGKIYVAWQGGSPYMIYLSSKMSGGSFGSPELVSDGVQFTSSQYYPSIMGHGAGNYPVSGTALVWAGYTGTYDVMFYSTEDFFLGAVYEPTEFKVKFDVELINAEPLFIDNTETYVLPGEEVPFDITILDYGSDDINFTYDFCDGTPPIFGGQFYNDGTGSDPEDSALVGVAPMEIKVKIKKIYYEIGTYFVNFSINDDDGGHVNATIKLRIPSAKELKEEAIRMLEPLVPGRMDAVGYQNVTVKFLGKDDDMTVLAYNYIDRPPYFWEMKLMYTYCDVDSGDVIFVNASSLTDGMFGNKLILKTYDSSRNLVDETSIPMVYSCVFPLKTGQKYGEWEIVSAGRKLGTTYHHFSKFALTVEDALDNILFSLNKDPRRGYGYWHTSWIFYCGEWVNRRLWIDDSHLDPQYGSIVFCEERNAVLNLMTVINNCLECDGVHNMTFRWTGKGVVDIEVYSYGLWWSWWNVWEHTHTFKGIKPGEEFFIGSRGYPLCGKLGTRTLIKVHRNSTGELYDAQYLRTSGFWPLEMEPGNIYGNLEIVETTLKLGCGNFWRAWFGDESVWDYFNWQTSRCGWDTDDCFDEEIASEEEARICENLSVVKNAINLLVMADDLLARFALWDAQNTSVGNESNQDEVDYHLKMAKRYILRGGREAEKGRPHNAIRDFRVSWKNSIIAVKWAIKGYEDLGNTTEDPGAKETWVDGDKECFCMCGEGNQGYKGPWWFWWYLKYQIELQRLFRTFPDWRNFTDPEYWGYNGRNEEDCEGAKNIKEVKNDMYIAWEDYYSDYDYNDWAMKVYETREMNIWTNKVSNLEVKFVADANEAGYVHDIHFAINLDKSIKYTWKMTFYDDSDTELSSKASSESVYGNFDQIIFDTADFKFKHDLDPYYVIVTLEFEDDIAPKFLGNAPYNTYMYVRNTKKYITATTTRPTTKSEARYSNPSLSGKYVPMMLVINDPTFEPPYDGKRIWTMYKNFDDWVIKGYPADDKWWS